MAFIARAALCGFSALDVADPTDQAIISAAVEETERLVSQRHRDQAIHVVNAYAQATKNKKG